jgi:hypothetical protein
MSTKDKLISHVNHIYNQRLKPDDLEKKIESLLLMADWSVKQNQITKEEYDEIVSEIEKRAKPPEQKKSIAEPIITTPKASPKVPKAAVIIILILLTSVLAVSSYLFFGKSKRISLINPSNIKKEGRVFRFNGKLVDSNGFPINHKVDVSFNLYNQKNDGKAMYVGSCSGDNGLVPEFDGSFEVSIGESCDMKRIPDEVFSKSQSIYLGVQVGSAAELQPRYPIATVSYANNTDKVKGLTLGTNESSIPYIDEEGRLVIGAVSPMLKSTKGDFSIEGQTVSLKTTEESGGSISLTPDNGGNVNILNGNLGVGTSEPQYKLDVQGTIGISDDLLLNGNTTSIYQNQGGDIKFYTIKDINDSTQPALMIASENKIGLATNKLIDTISAGGSISPVDNGKFNLGSATNKWKTIYTNGLVMGDEGIAAFWQRKGSILSPAKTDDDIVLGSQTEQNALVKLSGKSKSLSWINSGLLGIGTSTPHFLFTAIGGSDNNSLTSITNLSKYDTNGTNVLRLGLGTSTSGTSSRFLDFYAGATSEVSGTRVGSIRLQNGGVVYQTNGADFAEYMNVNERTEQGDIISIINDGAHKAVAGESSVGVVTDVAGFVGNAKESTIYTNKTLVGLVGQINVKVTNANGDIKTGDSISPSDIPGYGMKAMEAGTVVGIVLSSQSDIEENLSSSHCPPQNAEHECGKIRVLVSPHYFSGLAKTQHDFLKGTATIPAGETTLTIRNSNIKEYSIILLTAISSTPVTISLAEQKSCEDIKSTGCVSYFTVVSNKDLVSSLKFNWLIVN